MPSVKPFKGVLYNRDKIKDIGSVAAPPYDIIPKEMQDKLYRKNLYNIVKLELGKIRKDDSENNNRYTRARDFFKSWLDKKMLVQDEKESLYIYSQGYKYNGKAINRVGFLGLLGFGEGEKSSVLPHENTLSAPKQDRLNLMRQVHANLSPIFVLFDDESHKATGILKVFSEKNKPVVDIKWDGERHRIWRIDDEKAVKGIEEIMQRADMFIADGHHRFETARNYARELENSGASENAKRLSKYLMVYFVESDEKMLTILPAHRLIKDLGSLKKEDIKARLSRSFAIEKAATLSAMMLKLNKLAGLHAFGIYLGRGEFYLLKLKDIKESDEAIKDKSEEWKRLDVSILHMFIFRHLLGVRDDDDNIEFLKDPKETVKFIDKGKCKAAFFLNPTKASQVKKIASLGERMPRKATYFYPKPLSGLVINKLY